MTKKTTTNQLSRMLSIPKSRALEATLKAQLIAAVVREVGRRGLTHAELAHRSGLPRSAVTGILAGSLQRVTMDPSSCGARAERCASTILRQCFVEFAAPAAPASICQAVL